MYSVEEFLEQADQASDDDLERVVEQDDESGPHEDEAEEATENKDDEEGSARKVAKKVRKPSNRPKLDVERLKGPRGLASMEKLFTKIQFQGNGHEHEDLEAVMKTLHYWCHRLFPKYSFDDCLEHLERLGSKKPLITLKKKILFDLFEEDEPVVNDVEDDINPETEEAINEFDLLLQQEPINTLSQRPPTPPQRIELTEEQKERMERNRLIAIERRKARLEALQQKKAENENSSQTSGSPSVQLTEEQKALIERNRQIALEKRRARANISVTSSMVPSSQDLNSTVDSVDTAINSQTSNQSVNFNELVDSFFPASNDDNTQKTPDKDEDVDINDLIDEINPTEENIKKPVEKNIETENNSQNSNEDEMDINNLIENTTSKINSTVSDNQHQDNENDPTEENIENSNEDRMDINNLIETSEINSTVPDNQNQQDNENDKNSDKINLENSYDINSTKEDTTANLLEIE